jgi:hypothetical protein
MKLLDEHGDEMKDPNGNRMYEFQSTLVARVLSSSEYDVTKKQGDMN